MACVLFFFFFCFNFENIVEVYRGTEKSLELLKRKFNVFHNATISSKAMPALGSLLV